MNKLPDHPLGDRQTIFIDGKQIQVVNAWVYATKTLEVILDPTSPITNPVGLKNARKMAFSCCKRANPDIDFYHLMWTCVDGDEASLKQAHALIAFGVEMLVQDEFDKQNKNNEL